MSERTPPAWTDDDLCFAFRAGEMLVADGGARVPRLGEAGVDVDSADALGAGEMGGVACVAVSLPADYAPPAGLETRPLRELHKTLPADAFRTAGRASQLLEWERAHRFCGRCGSPTEECGEALARRCTGCGALHYPRLTPAVLISVVRDDRILLARSAHFRTGMFSTLAGFVEPGESLEETCIREVREEVGIDIADVRYFGSQPWPFPSQVMVAFTARYAGGELRPDPAEIEEAGWYAADEMPLVPPTLSLARALINDFVRAHGGDPAGLGSSA